MLDLFDVRDGVEGGEALGCVDVGGEEVLEINSNKIEGLDLNRGALTGSLVVTVTVEGRQSTKVVAEAECPSAASGLFDEEGERRNEAFCFVLNKNPILLLL